MKTNKGHLMPVSHGDIRLNKLYKAIKSPHSNSSLRYLEQVASAPVATMDHLFSQIQAHAQTHSAAERDSGDWRLDRLLACLEVLWSSMKRRPCQHDLLSLKSFKVCVRLVLQVLIRVEDNKGDMLLAVTKLNCAKCWFRLLEHLARMARPSDKTTSEKGIIKSVLKDIQSRKTHIHVLYWATDVSEQDMSPHIQHSAADRVLMTAKSYGLRGLTVQSTFFESELVKNDAYRRLLCHPLYFYLSQQSTINIFSRQQQQQQRQQPLDTEPIKLLSLCKSASQLLHNLIKADQDRETDVGTVYSWPHFIESVPSAPMILARTWIGSLTNMMQNDDPSLVEDNSRTFYCLTSSVSNLRSHSKVFMLLTPYQHHDDDRQHTPLTLWYTALPFFLAQILYQIQQHRDDSEQQQQEQHHQQERHRQRQQSKGNDGDSSSLKSKTNVLTSVYTTDMLKSISIRICYILQSCWEMTRRRKQWTVADQYQPIGQRMTIYLTNFLLALTAYPVSPEIIFTLGCFDLYGKDVGTPRLLSMDLCADVVIRGYFGLTGTAMEEHQGLLCTIWDLLIQHIQQVDSTWRSTIGPRVAWCIRTQMSLLHNENKLEESPLLPRFQKLIIYLLHDDGAIGQLADYSSGLSAYIWEPTIQQARQGLISAGLLVTFDPAIMTSSPDTTTESSVPVETAAALPPNKALMPETPRILSKAMKALVALEKVAHHPRACERLAETSILDLVDMNLVPSIMDYVPFTYEDNFPTQVWLVYGALMQLLSSLAKRTALLRSRLRQERKLVDVVMTLLWSTLKYQLIMYKAYQVQHRQLAKDHIKACQYVISSSLEVVYAYQYDKVAALQWLNWRHVDKGGNTLTLVSALLTILVPQESSNESGKDTETYRRWWNLHYQQTGLAASLLEQLSYFDECGSQLIQDNDKTLQNISDIIAVTSGLAFEDTLSSENLNNGVRRMSITNDANDGEIDTEMRNSRSRPASHGDNDADNDILLSLLCQDTLEDDQGDNLDDSPTCITVGSTDGLIPASQSIHDQYYLPLLRTVIKLVTSRANLKPMILTAGYTRLFGPFVLADVSRADREPTRLWHISKQLGQALWERIDDLERLFQFFGQNDEDITHRHELTAVALSYASFWETACWQKTLGIFGFNTESESVMYSTSPFGILCHMMLLNGGDQQHFSSVMAASAFDAKRSWQQRHRAAQALTLLASTFHTSWEDQLTADLTTNRQRLAQLLQKYQLGVKENDVVMDANGAKTVYLHTDDEEQALEVNVKDLTWISPVFEAMLSESYAETSTVQLHDITMASLKFFVHVSQLLQIHHERQQQAYFTSDDILDDAQGGWQDIVILIHVADRYGSPMIQLLGERWVMQQIKKRRDDYLSGCLRAYQLLRDNYHRQDGGGLTIKSWPFCLILNQCVKALLLDLPHVIETSAFKKMISDNDIEDLEAFSNAIMELLQQSSSI